ncbi:MULTISPECIES: hypothetical protein [unclassified Streptomyces]|uniref:hypothetical protein n=1 Tax=unclassified Streptomyces TaxID=2593676 RepID=UPI00093943A9|nr:hypothetical protein [Streptomyces sp. CB02009]OKJ49508.1 hypothetical protein AMK27_36190 [Streptomyces sp. CB02009]
MQLHGVVLLLGGNDRACAVTARLGWLTAAELYDLDRNFSVGMADDGNGSCGVGLTIKTVDYVY